MNNRSSIRLSRSMPSQSSLVIGPVSIQSRERTQITRRKRRRVYRSELKSAALGQPCDVYAPSATGRRALRGLRARTALLAAARTRFGRPGPGGAGATTGVRGGRRTGDRSACRRRGPAVRACGAGRTPVYRTWPSERRARGSSGGHRRRPARRTGVRRDRRFRTRRSTASKGSGSLHRL